MKDSELYRREAIEYAGQRSLGTTMITQPLTIRSLTLILLAVTSAGIIFLYFGEFARKETVSGYLKPDGGISRVYPAARGIAGNLLVTEGESVKKDQPLLQVRTPYSLLDGEEVNEKILVELRGQKERLEQSMEREKQKTILNRDWQVARYASLRDELTHLHRVQSLQISRTGLTSQQLQAVHDLQAKGYVSDNQLIQARAASLNEQKELARIARHMTQIGAEIKSTRHQLKILPIMLQEKLATLDKEVSDLNQRITEIHARSNYLVTAPIDGVITAINVNTGDAIVSDRAILSILPRDSLLFAWLLIPSRAAGMTNDGQRVHLMYDSFPYQKFGTQAGTIISISGAAINPGQLTGPMQVNEPVFIAKVALQKNTITAFGEEKPLQADMLLTADILQAKRSILDWMLNPLYALRGRTW
ncbi:MAG: HlyD family efflux transporter periplasmic adaptor subunit [Proteobacteria bacterium]|nr:HlyD family efflux transporter periplasmic adaptor subunit [Pseudomonadota bacterium]